MKKLFKKPRWLKPEVNEPKYWLHILIIAAIISYLYFGIFELRILLKLGLYIALGDVIAHTVLKMN